jgi:hypothetical protein
MTTYSLLQPHIKPRQPLLMPSTRLLKEINQASTLEIFAQHPLTHITQSRVKQKATLLKSCRTSKATSQGPTQQVYTRQSLQESLHAAVLRTHSKAILITANLSYHELFCTKCNFIFLIVDHVKQYIYCVICSMKSKLEFHIFNSFSLFGLLLCTVATIGFALNLRNSEVRCIEEER